MEFVKLEDKQPEQESMVVRLRKRAAIRRQIPTRKSVLEGKPDRISDLLEEAADEIVKLTRLAVWQQRRAEIAEYRVEELEKMYER